MIAQVLSRSFLLTWLDAVEESLSGLADSGDPDALATYAVDPYLPDDLPSRTHFFWTSGSAFRRALSAHPSIRHGFHASGPGRTARVIHDMLQSPAQPSIWLDYEQWHHHVTC